MDIILTVISKQCWDILASFKVSIPNKYFSNIFDIFHLITDFIPNLNPDYDFELYWQYSLDCFLPIREYFTYNAALNLSINREFFILLNDSLYNFKETKKFLHYLDEMEEYDKIVINRSKYDVEKISKPQLCLCKVKIRLRLKIPQALFTIFKFS